MSNLSKRSVVSDMRAIATKYHIMFGRKPKGFVMGVKDYFVLLSELKQMGKTGEGLALLDGLPIHLKTTSGIELLIDFEAAAKLIAAPTTQEKRKIAENQIIR